MSRGGVKDIRNTLLLCVTVIIFNSSKKAFYIIVIPLAVIHALYAPIGRFYGLPGYQHIASLLATDPREGFEFLTAIPIRYYLYALLILPLLLLFRFLSLKYSLQFYKNKTFLCVIIIFAMISPSPFSLLNQSIEAAKTVNKEMTLLHQLTEQNQWASSQFNGNYENYVIIIGESARKDYLHAYGYPLENTPFLTHHQGILVNGLTAGGTYTIGSLRLMLTKPDKKHWQPNYGLNLVNLIKSAGIETFWLSNQGFLGKFDTPISAIANQSDNKYFMKNGTYDSRNTSDFLLVDKFKTLIAQHKQHNQPKVYFLHLYGSHPNACDRIDDYPQLIDVKDKSYHYINCYISSIKKTDEIIRQIYSVLADDFQQNKRRFALLYFADHGLGHIEVNQQIEITNARKSKYHYDIPLFMTASDINTRTVCDAFKSGLNFTEALAAWIGIKNKQLGEYRLFDCRDDADDYGLKTKIKQITLDDPAIDLRGK